MTPTTVMAVLSASLLLSVLGTKEDWEIPSKIAGKTDTRNEGDQYDFYQFFIAASFELVVTRCMAFALLWLLPLNATSVEPQSFVRCFEGFDLAINVLRSYAISWSCRGIGS